MWIMRRWIEWGLQPQKAQKKCLLKSKMEHNFY
jgi:hypothetical protein